jgi:L-iditol 2-dehydrogenase
METMRAGIYHSNSDVRVEDLIRPGIGPGEILVKVAASGICGSDVLEWYRLKKAPLVLGHEIAGTVAETGEGVDRWRVGDRVFVSHHVPCNSCRVCLTGHHTACPTLHTTNFDPGGFAEYVRVPALQTETGVFVLPADVSFAEGTFVEPLACVIRAQRLAGLKPGETVLVIGSGISGLLHIALAAARGAGQVMAVDINSWRLEAARRFGASTALAAGDDLPERIREANEGRLADLVIVSTGATPAVQQSMHCVESGGTVLFFGAPDQEGEVTIPFPDIWRREITLRTSYGAAPTDFIPAIELIRRRIPVADMITHRLPLDEIARGFQLVAAGGESLKVVIEFP